MSTKEKNMDERIAFGNSLSEKRRESGFSQEELGLKIGKSSNAVSRYENAENTMDVHTFAKTVTPVPDLWSQIPVLVKFPSHSRYDQEEDLQ